VGTFSEAVTWWLSLYDYSRRVFPYFLTHKFDAFDTFKAWKVMVEKQTERKVKILRTDNGMEFCSNEFKLFCRKEGIVRHHTILHTPQQNDVVERMNRTIISKACCMLSNVSMGRQLCVEAASTACYLINRSPSTTIEKKTPMEVWSGSPSDYSQLKVFCCTAYAYVGNGKLEPRAAKYVFLGYGSRVKGYKLWNHETKKSTLSRSVVFNEFEMYYGNRATNAHDDVPQKGSV
jgi:transposase InsO family protein